MTSVSSTRILRADVLTPEVFWSLYVSVRNVAVYPQATMSLGPPKGKLSLVSPFRVYTTSTARGSPETEVAGLAERKGVSIGSGCMRIAHCGV